MVEDKVEPGKESDSNDEDSRQKITDKNSKSKYVEPMFDIRSDLDSII